MLIRSSLKYLKKFLLNRRNVNILKGISRVFETSQLFGYFTVVSQVFQIDLVSPISVV